MDRSDWFDSSVPLPPGLALAAIRRAIEYIERELAELVEIYHEQMNVFSAIVGIFGTKALDSVSSYEKHRKRRYGPATFSRSTSKGIRSKSWA